MKKVYIVIAAYNEEKSIPRVIAGLKKHGYNNIIVVDDGSKDKTFEVASKENVFVLRHFINRGQGASLKTGIDYALLRGADFIVTFDADGQHHPEDIKALLESIEKNNVEVALGSRFLKENLSIPFIRKLVLKIGIIVTRVLYGVKLSDSHNGFRVFSRKAAKMINITSDRMEHASQIVEEIHKKKIPFVEVPVTITYSDYSKQKGQSTLNSVKIGLRMIFRKFMR
ncbi:MAG: glycosyltransferase family 2 protein [Nanoarchaeota archaeon]|nr:glycosyltransferase family 2 protein [Nanoarchaeota archaeon]MBU1270136.1 glycosyltransferase family 2 protein [Nanoarchaeota archaeon]MBU1604458.1 glycosyltransferase family 2 protein [Nanoarchaeota archaeon]MBU2443467.1 glycosyltransferase family 2 protein [Nanoarchaeota archaeon]